MWNTKYISLSVLTIVLSLILFIDISYLNLFLAFIIIIALVFSNYSDYLTSLFKNNKSIFKLVIISFIYAVLLVFIGYTIKPIIEKSTNVPINYGSFQAITGKPYLLFISIGIGWLVGGLLEETIFRGYILQTIEKLLPKKLGVIPGVLLSSLLFGYLHDYQGISGQIITGITGMLFAIIYLYHRRNLWLNILTHGFLNTISLLLLYIN